MRNTIKNELFHLKDEKYKKFSLNLLPGVPEESLIGVRIPLIRKIGIEILKEPSWEEFLEETENLLFEEKMLQAMIIGLAKVDPVKKIKLIDEFLPKIDNWSICDSFCSGLKFAKEEESKKLVWEYIKPLFFNKSEYHVRFATVMALNYYLGPEYLAEVLKLYDLVKHEGYYVKMAISWGVSMAYVKDPIMTKEFIKNNSLDKFTHNKAIQKIRESFQVHKDEKELLKELKKG